MVHFLTNEMMFCILVALLSVEDSFVYKVKSMNAHSDGTHLECLKIANEGNFYTLL